MHHPIDGIAHTTDFVTPVMEHWLEREIACWVHPMKDRSNDPSHHERTLLPRSYISLPWHMVKDHSDSKRGNLLALRGLKITWVCITNLFISCSIIFLILILKNNTNIFKTLFLFKLMILAKNILKMLCYRLKTVDSIPP